jgi:flagellar hook-length control protein FliK
LPEAGLANASTDTGTATGAPGAKVPTAAAPAAAVAEPGDQDPAADGPDSAVAPPSSPTDEAAAVGLAATRSPSAALPARSGGAGESGTAAAHTASTPVEAAGLPNSSPTPAPLPHLLAESPLAPSGAPRGAGAALPVGGAAASSAPTIAQQAASALDVDDLSGSISRPLSDGNGTYTVTVALHPPELGHVQAVMSLEGNDLVVSLTAQTQTGHDALASASEALKNQLARGGVNVNVTLRDPGSQAGADERYRPPTSPGSAGPLMTGSAATETPLSSGLVSGQIHLVL